MVHINKEEELSQNLVIKKTKKKRRMWITFYFKVHTTFHQERAVKAHLAHKLVLNVQSVAMGTFRDLHRNHYSWSKQFHHVLKRFNSLH